jgi:hypothetical protein
MVFLNNFNYLLRFGIINTVFTILLYQKAVSGFYNLANFHTQLFLLIITIHSKIKNYYKMQ